MTSSRSALLQAAVDVFTERGYEAATVAEIAERAGVTTGALYSHFHGKLDLLLQSLGLRSMEGLAEGSLSGAAWARPSSVATVVAHQMATAPAPETTLLLDVIVAARRDPKLAATLRRLLALKISEFVAATERSIDAGTISPGLSTDDLARFMTMVAFGNMVLAVMGERLPPERAFVEVMGQLLFGADGAAESGPTDILAGVALAASTSRQSRASFEQAVAAASDAGHSLRRIAQAAGVSHEHVRRIVVNRVAPTG
ncbi:MAG TPA: helix-turn-helix domain-containing protein [Acidimicrobiales bacterium]|nr:helix-turn-helix domain-containing protein [Acidimicrobiales bacterium]